MGSEWSELPASEFCDSVRDGTHDSPKQVDEGKLLVTSRHITGNRLDLSSAYKISDSDYEEINRRSKVDQWDVLFTMIGTVGEPCLVSEEPNFAIKNIGLFKNSSETRGKFLYYYLCSPEAQHHTKSHSRGTTQQYIPLGELRKFPVRFPSDESEMEAIAHILGTLDDKIELNRRINATLEGMAQALFKSWFVDFDPVIDNALAAGNPIPDELTPRAEVRRHALTNETTQQGSVDHPNLSDPKSLFHAAFQFTEDLGWIPEGWEAKPFGNLLENTIGGDWGKETEDEKHTFPSVIIRGTDMPHIQAGNRSSAPERWVEPKKFATRELQDSDIVIEISGGSSTQSTGRSLYVTNSILRRLGGSVEPASFCRRFRPINQHYGLFGALHLGLIYQQGKMWEYQNQSTGISNFQTTSFLSREFVAFPDNAELIEEFYGRVRPLIDKMTSNQQELLAKLRDTLLPKLISGELRTKAIDSMVKEVTA